LVVEKMSAIAVLEFATALAGVMFATWAVLNPSSRRINFGGMRPKSAVIAAIAMGVLFLSLTVLPHLHR
jgi:hypothetical protein